MGDLDLCDVPGESLYSQLVATLAKNKERTRTKFALSSLLGKIHLHELMKQLNQLVHYTLVQIGEQQQQDCDNSVDDDVKYESEERMN